MTGIQPAPDPRNGGACSQRTAAPVQSDCFALLERYRGFLAEVRRALIGPGLRPGPRRQARWAGRGLRRSRVGPEYRFCGAVRNDLRVPLTLERPAQTMRGVPARRLLHLHGSRRTWREHVGLAVVLAGAAAGYGGDRRRPVTGAAVRGSSPCRRACVRRTRRKLPPRNGGTRVNPGRLRRVTLAAPSLSTARARPRCSRPGPSGPARRRCALEAVEKVVTA